MPEMRQPGKFPQRGSQRPARRSPPPPKPTPVWVKVGLIIAPLVLIGLVANLYYGKESSSSEPVVQKEDPNVKIGELRKQIPKFKADWSKFAAAKDSKEQKKLGDALVARIEKWGEEWDAIFEPLRDAKGKLPSDLQAYSKDRAEVNQIRHDILKISGF